MTYVLTVIVAGVNGAPNARIVVPRKRRKKRCRGCGCGIVRREVIEGGCTEAASLRSLPRAVVIVITSHSRARVLCMLAWP